MYFVLIYEKTVYNRKKMIYNHFKVKGSNSHCLLVLYRLPFTAILLADVLKSETFAARVDYAFMR